MKPPRGSVTSRDPGTPCPAFLTAPVMEFNRVSEERLRLLLTAAQSDQLQFAHFAGPKLRYGGAIVNSVSIGTHFDEDEW